MILKTSGAAVLLASLALAGCATGIGGGDHAAYVPPITPTEQFSIEVQDAPDRIQLAARTGQLSPAQVQALGQLAARWRGQTNPAPILIESPAGAQNAEAAFRMAAVAARVLSDNGVPPAYVASTSYNAAGLAGATVQVGFTRKVLVGPECASHQSDFTKTGDNRPTAGFGCSVVANMAAQIANPEDVLGPRAEDYADAARRGTVLKKYREGQPTGTPRPVNPVESTRIAD